VVSKSLNSINVEQSYGAIVNNGKFTAVGLGSFSIRLTGPIVVVAGVIAVTVQSWNTLTEKLNDAGAARISSSCGAGTAVTVTVYKPTLRGSDELTKMFPESFVINAAGKSVEKLQL